MFWNKFFCFFSAQPAHEFVSSSATVPLYLSLHPVGAVAVFKIFHISSIAKK
jgi:hypothetical protein